MYNNNAKLTTPSLFLCISTIIAALITCSSCSFRNSSDEKIDHAIEQVQEFTETKTVIRAQTIKTMVEPMKELVSYSYSYGDIAELTKKKIFEEQHLLKIKGKIKVGVDLSEMQCAVNNNTMTIYICLPEHKIISHEAAIENSYKLKNSIFVEVTPEDTSDELEKLKESKEQELMEDKDFWDNVNNQTELTITSLLRISDQTKDYSIKFVDADEFSREEAIADTVENIGNQE